MAAGIAFIVLGLFLAWQPLITGVATGLLIAWVLLVAGAFSIAAAFRNRSHDGWWLYGLLGLLAVLLGLFSLFVPLAAALSLVWVIGFWLLVSGFVEIVAALRLQARVPIILLGLLNVVLGIILLMAPPATALWYLAIITGISFIMRGVGSISFALSLRRLSHAIHGRMQAR
jgi:uncharacterized membrane protein HdeD (DUF308 family)